MAESAKVKVKRLRPGALLPERATSGATGLDLFACIDGGGTIVLGSGPSLVGTGIAIEVPQGYDAQIRPRSGLAARGVGVVFGTVDSDYRGELMVTMHVLEPAATYEVRHGDRIAQLVVSRLPQVSIEEIDELTETKRGTAGHGSTGR